MVANAIAPEAAPRATAPTSEPIPIEELPNFNVEAYCRKFARLNLKTLNYDSEVSLSLLGGTSVLEIQDRVNLHRAATTSASGMKLPIRDVRALVAIGGKSEILS